MFKRILVCVDPSVPDENILACCAQMKTLGIEEAILAHVIYVANTPGLEKMLAEQARPEMERQKSLLEKSGLKVTIEMPLGVPAPALHSLAEKHDVSVIVIGTHGRGVTESIVLQRVALGNVCTKLLHFTSRPVLLIRSTIPTDECIRECRELFSRVLFPTDFSDTAEVAFVYLERVVRATRCQVTLLHVRDHARPEARLSHRLEELQNLDRNKLHRLKHHLEDLGASQVHVEVALGHPGDKILEVAKGWNCSLVLMGTQGKGVARELVLGSVAHQVARHTARPVLFIPAIR